MEFLAVGRSRELPLREFFNNEYGIHVGRCGEFGRFSESRCREVLLYLHIIILNFFLFSLSFTYRENSETKVTVKLTESTVMMLTQYSDILSNCWCFKLW